MTKIFFLFAFLINVAITSGCSIPVKETVSVEPITPQPIEPIVKKEFKSNDHDWNQPKQQPEPEPEPEVKETPKPTPIPWPLWATAILSGLMYIINRVIIHRNNERIDDSS